VAVALLTITARTLLPRRDSGWSAALIWIISPIAILGGATIRQYSLLTIWIIIFTLLLGNYLLNNPQPEEKRRLVLGLLVTAIVGLLTHLVFSLVLCAAFVTIILNDRESKRRFILLPLLVIMTGVLLVAFFIPESLLLHAYLAPKIQTIGFQDELMVRYLRRSFMLLSPLLIPLGVFLVTYVSMRVRNKPVSFSTAPDLRATLGFLLTMLILTYGLHSVMYLTGVFYPYTISDHHLLYITPLVALVATGLLQLIPRTNIGSLATIGLMVGLFLITALRVGSNMGDARGTIDLHQLSNYDLIVVDLINRPELFPYMNPDSQVYANYQPDLISRQEDWLPRLISEGGIYVSLLETGNYAIGDAEGREQILRMIEEKGSVKLIGSTTDQGATVSVYEVDN